MIGKRVCNFLPVTRLQCGIFGVKWAIRCLADISGGVGENRSAGEIFITLILSHFFPALTLWLFCTHLLTLEEMKYHPWEVLVINIDMQPRKRKKKHSVQADSCLIPAVLKQAEKFLSQPFTEEMITLPFQQCRFIDCIPASNSVRDKNAHLVYGFYRSKFWILIHWMPTLSCCVKQTLLAHLPMSKIGIDKGVYDNEWAKGCSVENKISKSEVSVSSQ